MCSFGVLSICVTPLNKSVNGVLIVESRLGRIGALHDDYEGLRIAPTQGMEGRAAGDTQLLHGFVAGVSGWLLGHVLECIM